MPLSDEFPLDEGDPPVRQTGPAGEKLPSIEPKGRPPEQASPGSNAGLELLLRYGMHAAAVLLVVLIGWAARHYYIEGNIAEAELPQQAALAAPVSAPVSQDDGGENPAGQTC